MILATLELLRWTELLPHLTPSKKETHTEYSLLWQIFKSTLTTKELINFATDTKTDISSLMVNFTFFCYVKLYI